MPYDPQIVEAELALGHLRTERLPAVAQDAMEAGFDGPATVRVAITDPRDGWEISQRLPAMLAELGLAEVTPQEAAVRLAKQRAQRVLTSKEDPSASLGYFYELFWRGDYADELSELGNLDDLRDCYSTEDLRVAAFRFMEELLDADLQVQRRSERAAAAARRREAARQDWPYVFDSPTRKKILRQRLFEKFEDKRLLWMIAILALAVGWLTGFWLLSLGGLITYCIVIPLIAYWVEWRKLKKERRDILLRMRFPEDQI